MFHHLEKQLEPQRQRSLFELVELLDEMAAAVALTQEGAKAGRKIKVGLGARESEDVHATAPTTREEVLAMMNLLMKAIKERSRSIKHQHLSL